MTVEMHEVARNTYLLDCGQIPVFLMPQVAYLVVGEEASALIEPGCTTAASRLLDASAELGLDLGKVACIIPTHIHVDHAGGMGYLAQKLPQAKVLVHPRGAAHVTHPSRLAQATRTVFGENYEESFGVILPVPEDQVHVLEEGEAVRLGERELTVLFSPGHASHHISILDSLTNGLFCGEALGFPADGASDVVLPAGIPPFDAGLYLESIEKLERLRPRLLFYSHIGARSNENNHLIERVKETSTAFGEIVREAVEAGEDDDGIVARLSVYIQGHSLDADLLNTFKFDPSGYIDYFRSKA